MSDDARPLIDNPYRASHTPIYAGGVNVTDLMARAWDRGFAAGDERLRSDYFDKRLDESWEPSPAALPDERLREALREIEAALRDKARPFTDEQLPTYVLGLPDVMEVVRFVLAVPARPLPSWTGTQDALAAAADREAPDECRAPHCWYEYGTPCGTCPVAPPVSDEQEKP